MKTNVLIESWRQGDQDSSLLPSPQIDNQLIQKIRGGASAGNVCSLSAECNGGTSCAYWWETATNLARFGWNTIMGSL